MTIDRDDVEQVAELAKLDLDDAEVEQFRDQLGDILEYVEQLRELDTSGVEPTTHAALSAVEGRSDEVEGSLARDQVLENAPSARDGQFEVPKVVD